MGSAWECVRAEAWRSSYVEEDDDEGGGGSFFDMTTGLSVCQKRALQDVLAKSAIAAKKKSQL